MTSLIILFIAGLLIGSFLNVLSLRYKPAERLFSRRTIGGRSVCRTCAVTLKWYELVPLFSFLIQGAKCRHCEHSLSWQYPVVELLTGLLTAAVPAFLYSFFGVAQLALTGQPLLAFYLVTAIWLLATYAFITTAIIDIRHTILPDQINVFLGILGLGLVATKHLFGASLSYRFSFLGQYAGIFRFEHLPIANAVIAVITALLLFGLIIGLTRGRGMGMGDLKIAVSIGLLLGWPDALFSFMFAFVIGAIVGILMLISGAKKMKDGVPFGPFLILGIYAVMFYGQPIVHWYFSLIP